MDGIFKNNTYKILELFIQFPAKDFSVRGIARDLKLSHVTVLNHINDLGRLGLIKKKKETLYPTFYANPDNNIYKIHKKSWLLFKIVDSGVIEYIQKETFPSSIVLFGSGAKATFTEKSDIDIFIEAKETPINLTKYERRLGRKINLLFEPNINNLSKELRNNIINGTVLYGFIKIRGD